ncbi:hypothetical protein V6N13_088300 [Hibiscus sabdariffa]
MDDDKASKNEKVDLICMGKSILSGGLLNQENSVLNLVVLEMLGNEGIMSGDKSVTCPMNNSHVLSGHLRQHDSFGTPDLSLVSNTEPTFPEDGFIKSILVVGVDPSVNLGISLEHNLSFGENRHLKSFDLELVEGILGDQIAARPLVENVSDSIGCGKENTITASTTYQEHVLTKVERKKRDRTLKKMKNQAVMVEQSELERGSLSDSGLQISWDFATKEVEKVVEMGAKLGVQFIGPMEEVNREIAELEMNESDLKEKLVFDSLQRMYGVALFLEYAISIYGFVLDTGCFDDYLYI